jgi:hypothetical protein
MSWGPEREAEAGKRESTFDQEYGGGSYEKEKESRRNSRRH